MTAVLYVIGAWSLAIMLATGVRALLDRPRVVQPRLERQVRKAIARNRARVYEQTE